MTASPSINNVFLTNSGYLYGIVFISNTTTGASGMVKTTLHDYVGGVCQTSELAANTSCIPVTSSPYISNLNYMVTLIYSSASLPSSGCVRTYICSNETTCPTCTLYSTSAYNSKTNLPVDYSLGTYPEAVYGINITLGDRSAVVKFTPPTNTYVTYYELTLTQGSSYLVNGLFSLYNSSGGIPINNLTNGLQYNLSIRAISDDGYFGNPVSVNFTPIQPCTQPACSFTIT